MNWIDAAIIIVFLYFIITAFSAGLIRETLGIASAVAGAVIAGLCYDELGKSVFSSIDNATTQNVVAFLAIFLSISIIGQLVAMLTKPAITVLQLGIFDQLGGAALGMVKAFIFIEVVLILFVTYPRYHMDKRIDDSRFASRMLDASEPMLKVLPDVFNAKVTQFNGSGSNPSDTATTP
jgi:uncharacterized membrane protein required for colicin V production